jgi:predicted nucleic acid-binding protein
MPTWQTTLKHSGKNLLLFYTGEVKLYLDNSFLNRPFDDPQVGMNKDEGSVLFAIIQLAKEGRVHLVRSALIEVENATNDIAARKSFVDSVMNLAAVYQNLSDSIVSRAQTIVQEYRLQPLDAAHLASAEAAQVDFFITCDYTVLKRYHGILHVVTPLQFQQQYENNH